MEPRVSDAIDLGSPKAPRSMASDTLGSIWILDHKGAKIARIRPGGLKLETAWQGEDRLTSIAWDGRRMLALDFKGRRVVEICEANQLKTVAAGYLEKPVALASDLLGRFAVMDEKAKTVTLFGRDGVSLGVHAMGEDGPSKVDGLVMYPAGGFGVVPGSGATVYRFR